MTKAPVLVLAASIAVVVASSVATSAAPPASAPVTRTIYFSATDAKNAPVTDLTAADVTVKDGGKAVQIDKVAPASAPLHIAVILDDNGSGGYQGALAQIIQATVNNAQFSFRVLNPQAQLVQDFTKDFEALKAALARVGPRGTARPDPDQVIDGIGEAAKDFITRKVERPVILVITSNGDSTQSTNTDRTLDLLKDSKAMLNVMMLSNVSLGRLLGDGPKSSGGRSEPIGGSPAIPAAAQRIIDHLTHQYVLTYTLPDGAKPNERVQVATSRKGVTITAPSRLSDK